MKKTLAIYLSLAFIITIGSATAAADSSVADADPVAVDDTWLVNTH